VRVRPVDDARTGYAKRMPVLLIILLVLVVLVGLLWATYNGLVSLRNRIEAAWAQIEVQLKRRHDLIPNLVETVKGYAAHESSTLEKVIQARNAAVAAKGVAGSAAAESGLSKSLGGLFALGEAYPDLKANASFLQVKSPTPVSTTTTKCGPTTPRSKASRPTSSPTDSGSSCASTSRLMKPSAVLSASSSNRVSDRVSHRVSDQVTDQAPPSSYPSLLRVAGALGLGLVVPLLAVALITGLPWWAAVLVAVVGATVITWKLRDAGERTVLSMIQVTEGDVIQQARLQNLLEGLCDSAGVPRPDLYVMAAQGLNTLVVARPASPGHGSVVVTSGLVHALSRLELEAVLAHQLAQLKRGDLLQASNEVMLSGLPLVIAERGRSGGAWRFLAALSAPLVGRSARALHQFRPAVSWTEADLAAVSITRYPPSLVTALQKVNGQSSVPGVAGATAHLWFAAPSPPVADHYPQVSERIAVLHEL
jgi:Zn-dependent protease with chaperone function